MDPDCVPKTQSGKNFKNLNSTVKRWSELLKEFQQVELLKQKQAALFFEEEAEAEEEEEQEEDMIIDEEEEEELGGKEELLEEEDLSTSLSGVDPGLFPLQEMDLSGETPQIVPITTGLYYKFLELTL